MARSADLADLLFVAGGSWQVANIPGGEVPAVVIADWLIGRL